jgi:hypothetical protein
MSIPDFVRETQEFEVVLQFFRPEFRHLTLSVAVYAGFWHHV